MDAGLWGNYKMDYFRAREKHNSVNKAEAEGKIADSMEVRIALIENGIITLTQGGGKVNNLLHAQRLLVPYRSISCGDCICGGGIRD